MRRHRRVTAVLPGSLSAALLVAMLPLAALAADDEEAPPPLPADTASRVVQLAHTYVGTPYVMGAESHRAIDSSALVRNVFREAGLWGPDAPRTALEQIKVGARVALDEVAAGDRLYFDFSRSGTSGRTAPGVADHTGIFIGGSKFIHATPRRCRVDSLAGRYRANLLAARRDRVLDEEARPPLPEGPMRKVLEIAYTYLGTPYKFGGESRRAIDTSAFVKAAFVQASVWKSDAPRTALEQIKVGKVVRGNELQPGDRLYFDFNRSGTSGRTARGVADHTGIFIGNGRFIHATPPRCRIDTLTGSYLNHLMAARRDE